MHLRTVLHILGNLLVLLALLLVLPLVTALLCDDGKLPLERYEVLAFFVSIAVAAIVGLALRTMCELDLARIGHREGAAVVTMSWLVFSLVGAMPFLITGAAGFTDAFFETISGFTTTGASIFPEVEILPRGLQLWRCQTQWMGGMGIVVLSVAILPMLGAGGYRLFKAETPGGSTFERNAPRIKDTATVLWMLYLGMSAAQMLLLRLGGMTLYDAACHAFTTLSTGGFSTSTASLGAWSSPFIQWTVIAFMLLAGLNFDLHQQIVARRYRSALQNREARAFLLLLLGASLVCFLTLRSGPHGDEGAEATLRGAAFQVVSIGTTTGYATRDFDRWPDLLRLTLLLMMFVGGCTGSTAGGMKVMRLVIFLKSAFAELYRTVNPRAVLVLRIGHRTLSRESVSNVMNFLLMWIALFAAVTYTMTLLGLDLLGAVSATVASLGNIGPGLGSVGPRANYAHLPLLGKWVLVVAMLLGRLELYSVLVLGLRRTWVR